MLDGERWRSDFLEERRAQTTRPLLDREVRLRGGMDMLRTVQHFRPRPWLCENTLLGVILELRFPRDLRGIG